MIYILVIILFLILLYLFMIAPKKRRQSALSPFLGVHYAHRGLFDNNHGIPENSLLAFNHAVQGGYGIELDVHLTKDKQLVVFHDDSLTRMCGITDDITSKTYDELLKLSLLNTKEKIPLLSQVLELVQGKVPLLIEIKLPTKELEICTYLDTLMKTYHGHYCIESFNTLALYWYRRNHPQIIRGQLSAALTKDKNVKGFLLPFLVEHLLTNFLGRPDFISYCYADAKNLSYLLNKHLFHAPVMAWTFRSYPIYKKYKENFDSFIFEGFHIEK